MTFTPQGQAVSGGSDGRVYVWKQGQIDPAEQWECTTTGNDTLVTSVAASDERILAVNSLPYKAFTIWQVVDGKSRMILHEDHPVRSALVSPDTGCVFAFGEEFHSWNARWPERATSTKIDFEMDEYQAVLSPDGGRVYLGNINGQIAACTTAGGAIQLIGAHKNYVTVLALTADGRYLVCGGWDTTIRIWDIEKRLEVGRYTWELPLECGAAHYDGKSQRVVVGDKQGGVLFFTFEDSPPLAE